MKKVIFIVSVFLSLVLFAEETNWISYDGWVTGPGSEDNKYTYLLPFSCSLSAENVHCDYRDDRPLLYETDMGLPVPNEEESELKYLLFGDTFFFMRDNCGRIMSKITDENDDVLLDFNIDEDVIDDSDLNSHFESCDDDTYVAEIEWENNFSATIKRTYSNVICFHDCLKNNKSSNCYSYCNMSNDENNNTDIFIPNYSECISYCMDSDNSYLLDYLNFDADDNEEKCKKFCTFDMVETYASRGYFLYDGINNPETNNRIYNNGTNNVFLAAKLEKNNSGNETQYKIKFTNIQPEGSDLNSAQIYSTVDNTHRRSKSIWMNSYERNLGGMIGIYPRGYFYACEGAPNDGCQRKKLFVPYDVGKWDFLEKATFCGNWFNNPGNNDTETELKRQKEEVGIGVYDFENECRVKFSTGSDILFPSCITPNLSDEEQCFREEENYPNKHILWPNLSKMSNLIVIQGIERDILSIDDQDKYAEGYIYFMGTGETEVDTSTIDCSNFDNINYRKTQKAYIARVPAYESKIKCPASYEYFKGITNGIARWSKNMEDAEPLYGFYPLQAMGAESIVKHRDLYWMTAPLNETPDTPTHEDKKGVVILASPDALHWQKVDTILFGNPKSIGTDYAFLWLPPKLIETGDNTMPFLYSIWKSNENKDFKRFAITGNVFLYPNIEVTLNGFLDNSFDPKFTHYNLKSGKYKFMEKEATRAFLVDNVDYGNLLRNTIPIRFIGFTLEIPIFNYSSGAIPLSFNTFQNLGNLDNTGWTSNEISEEKNKLKNRYVIIEYCRCLDQAEELCKSSEGFCPPYKGFINTDNNDMGNWKIIDIVEDKFFNQYVLPCKNGNENIPDYMCNIPFEHNATNLQQGHKNIPVWNWRYQIAKDYPAKDENSANVILRFSHWYNLPFVWDNFPEINKQLMENSKLVPLNCDEALAETDDDDEFPDEDESDDADADEDLIAKTCKDPSSWRTSKMIYLRYKAPEIDENKLRLEYLYPYPVIISDFGKPGDPAPDVWDMLTADHFSREFFKVSSFEYADLSLRTLTSGAAATAVVKNGQMQIYAWGGTVSLIPRSTSLAGILYVGTYNPETEVVTFMSEILDETDPNSPVMTAGASMVYDDENDKIYLIGAVDQNGTSRIYRLEDARTGRKWESVAAIDLGRYFRLVKKSEHEYFAFGGQTGETSFNTKVYLLDLNNMTSPQLITNIPTSGLANSFAAYSEMDQKLYIFGGQDSNGASERFLSFDTKTAAWSEINVSGGPGAGYGGVILVDYITETISLGGGVFENSKDRQFKWIFNPKDLTWTKELKSGSYCLKETGTTLQGGLEFGGECVPFTHPWYNSFSAGATVYSLDGKGNRLYVGTNNAIKIYDISDPISPVLVSSFPTSSRVNDLEVYGDTLFAATNSGLYKLDASDPDELTQLLFISATLNYQYKVEVYNGKLYVGDDNGIKVRDLETMSVLTSVNNGSVLDFAIENGEIGLYKDALFSPVEIRDADTLTLKANEFFGCFEIEVGSSDGRFYLSCDDETYRFEDDGDGGISFTELSGDIRELQDVYTFDGYTYFYDENTIWISTSNDVPALCGNGIVEGDEVCDGTPINCEDLDSNYVSGTATCNSTCDGYNTNNCSDDGW